MPIANIENHELKALLKNDLKDRKLEYNLEMFFLENQVSESDFTHLIESEDLDADVVRVCLEVWLGKNTNCSDEIFKKIQDLKQIIDKQTRISLNGVASYSDAKGLISFFERKREHGNYSNSDTANDWLDNHENCDDEDFKLVASHVKPGEILIGKIISRIGKIEDATQRYESFLSIAKDLKIDNVPTRFGFDQIDLLQNFMHAGSIVEKIKRRSQQSPRDLLITSISQAKADDLIGFFESKDIEHISRLLSHRDRIDPSIIANAWLKNNPDCNYNSFRSIAKRISNDKERTNFVVDRALGISDENERYNFFLDATKDDLTYGLAQEETAVDIATSYLKCKLPTNKIADFCFDLYQTNEWLRTNIFEHSIRISELTPEEVLESAGNFLSDLSQPNMVRNVMGFGIVTEAVQKNPSAENNLYQKWGERKYQFIFDLLGDMKPEDCLTEESLKQLREKYKEAPDANLATFICRESLSDYSSHLELSLSEAAQESIRQKSFTANNTPYITRNEGNLLRKSLGIVPSIQMSKVTTYLKSKIGNIPTLTPEEIDGYEINFEDPSILRKRAELNKQFAQIDEEITPEKIADFCKKEWAEDKKLDPAKLAELREFFVKNKKMLAALFQHPEEFNKLMANAQESAQKAEEYLREKVEELQLQPLATIDNYRINFEEPKFVQEKRKTVNEKFRDILKSKDPADSESFKNRVLDFFETYLGTKINPQQKLKLAKSVAHNRDGMTYLFQQQGKFDSFMNGCVGSLGMGCVANIGTQTDVSFSDSLTEKDPYARIIYPAFAKKICTQLLNSTGFDQLGIEASGAGIFSKDVITSSHVAPAGFIRAIQNEFVSEEENIRDPWSMIELAGIDGDRLEELEEMFSEMAEADTKDLQHRLDELLLQQAQTPEYELKKINNAIIVHGARSLSKDEMAALRERKQEIVESKKMAAEDPKAQEEQQRIEAINKEIDSLKKEIAARKTEVIQGKAKDIATYITLQNTLPQILQGSQLKTEVEEILTKLDSSIKIEPATSVKSEPPITFTNERMLGSQVSAAPTHFTSSMPNDSSSGRQNPLPSFINLAENETTLGSQVSATPTHLTSSMPSSMPSASPIDSASGIASPNPILTSINLAGSNNLRVLPLTPR